jgi:gamma-glutamyltranspeptidase/glutathione hydrolase
MVSSAHPLASQAGLEVLRQGGHAVDAAIAVNAVLQVTQPQMCGLGGDLFALIFEAESGRVTALNGSGRSPHAADPQVFLRAGLSAVPSDGVIAANVPGCLDAWLLMHQRHGRLAWPALLGPAIEYAVHGFPVSRLVHEYMTGALPRLRRYPSSLKVLCPEGELPQPGSLLRQPDLGRTLRLVAEGGRQAFYEGPLAEAISAYCRERGGWLAARDFREHRSFWTQPIETSYRGLRVLEHPPNSQGFALLEQLNLLELQEPPDLLSPEGVDLLVRIKKAAFRDRDLHNTDPEHMRVPVQALISKEHARELAPLLNGPAPAAGDGAKAAGDTTYFCVVDAEGNAVSLIQSIFHAFGCGEVAGGTGLFLQNRMSAFSLDPGQANVLAPHKRTAHTLNPAMVFRGDQPLLVLGTMGGDGQTQTLLQLLAAILDCGCTPQEAVELPRWRSDPDGRLSIEGRFPRPTLESLRGLGYELRIVEDWSQEMGHAHLIRILSNGVLSGAADPRGDGFAVGY